MNPDSHIPIINLPGSKSISNRLLLIKAIGDLSFKIENISDSDDTTILQKYLLEIKSGKSEIDIHHAGTNMRFLCSYLATLENKSFTLTGSERMKQRPIKDLVDALKQIEADINYIEKEGYPPLKINGKKLIENEITINANVSSQFTTSLLLIAPTFENGLKIKLSGQLVSPSYIKLTIELMRSFEIDVEWKGDEIIITKGKYKTDNLSFYNESDWSAASYFYSAMALGKIDQLELHGLNKNSLQPDSIVAKTYEQFGITTEYHENKITLHKTKCNITNFKFDFTDCPDIAQTLAITCLGLRINAELTGLQTLKIKETDRILALKTELEKFGAVVEANNNSLKLNFGSVKNENKEITIQTYNDHRMAMSFAPLQFLFPKIKIENKNVVSKSFLNFWNEASKLNLG